MAQVQAVFTRWAAPYDHHAICVGLDGMLRSMGVVEDHVRRRIAAHVIVAVGWKMNCWNHNFLGMKTGSGYTGDWYVKGTEEEYTPGVMTSVPDAAWRSYESFAACYADWFVPRMTRYSWAYAALLDPNRPDRDYWYELGPWFGPSRGGYYTSKTADKGIQPDGFASICRRVEDEVAKATPAERAAALAIDVNSSTSAKKIGTTAVSILFGVAVLWAAWTLFSKKG